MTPPAVRVLGPVSVQSSAGPLRLAPDETVALAALVVARPPFGPHGLDDVVLGELVLPEVEVRRTDRLAGRLRTLVRDLRSAGVGLTIEHRDGRWTLAAGPGVVDADVLALAVARAEAAVADRSLVDVPTLLAGAMPLTGSRPLDGLGSPWFDGPRETLAAMQSQARLLRRTASALPLRRPAAPSPAPRRASPAPAAPTWGTAPQAGGPRVVARGASKQTTGRRVALPDGSWGDVAPGPSAVPAAASPRPPAPLPQPGALIWCLFGAAPVRLAGAPLDLHDELTRAVLAVLLVGRRTPVPVGEVLGGARPGWTTHDPVAWVEEHLDLARARTREVARTDLPVTCAPSGDAWTLTVAADAVDLDRADRLVSRARSTTDPTVRADQLREALRQVVGEPLDDLPGAAFDAARERLTRWREALLLEAVAADLAAGATERALPDLRALVETYPLREDLWEWLVVATGRHEGKAAALAVYDRAVHRLDRLLGAAPGPRLQAARREAEERFL